jgi:hypothetical protein
MNTAGQKALAFVWIVLALIGSPSTKQVLWSDSFELGQPGLIVALVAKLVDFLWLIQLYLRTLVLVNSPKTFAKAIATAVFVQSFDRANLLAFQALRAFYRNLLSVRYEIPTLLRVQQLPVLRTAKQLNVNAVFWTSIRTQIVLIKPTRHRHSPESKKHCNEKTTLLQT